VLRLKPASKIAYANAIGKHFVIDMEGPTEIVKGGWIWKFLTLVSILYISWKIYLVILWWTSTLNVFVFWSTDQTGAQWCYVRTPVKTYLGNHGHSTCSDLQRSGRYPGMVWSYQACATPYLTSDVCSYLLQSYYSNNNNGNYRNPIKPRIGETQVEGVYKDPKDGKTKKGNKWLKFPSSIGLTDIIKKPKVEKDSTTTLPAKKSSEDAVVFG